MKYAFVILHYNVIQETLDCVKSILEKTHKEVSIIIVPVKHSQSISLETKTSKSF